MSGLEVRGLCHRYPGRDHGLEGIDMDAPRGQITAVVGPNGAGKSTLLKCIVGIFAYQGTLRLDGKELEGLKAFQRAQKIAYIPQQSPSQTSLSVRSMVEMGRFASARSIWGLGPDDHAVVEQSMDAAGVLALAKRRFSELSGGEMKRVLLARALATGASTLMLDEPSSALDLYQVLEFQQLLLELRDKNYSIVVVLHDLVQVNAYADRVVMLQNQAVVSQGKTQEVLHSRDLSRVFRVQVIPGGALGFLPREHSRDDESEAR